MSRDDPPFDITISIATYDRPALLAKTLESCVAQTNRLGLRYEILITDNHPSGNAAPVAEAFAHRLPVRYQSNTTRNMSELRNVGIKGALGAWVAFIDDDEFADPDWLDALMGAARRTDADIVIGPRLATFATGKAPAYDPHGDYFQRVYDLPADSVIVLTAPDGRPLYGLGTGNSLCRAATCVGDAEPFDPAFGDAGGEDIEFFMRQHILGRKLVWAPDAKVTEVVPEHRTKVAYRLIRARRETQIFVSTYMAHATHPDKTRREMMIKGAIQTILGVIFAVATLEFGSERRIAGRLLMTKGLGKLSWLRPVGYINETTFKPAKNSA